MASTVPILTNGGESEIVWVVAEEVLIEDSAASRVTDSPLYQFSGAGVSNLRPVEV